MNHFMPLSAVSRGDAKRMLRLATTSRIEIDFGHVRWVGPSFADEIWRVWWGQHRDAEIVAKNATKSMRMMINRAIGARAQGVTK